MRKESLQGCARTYTNIRTLLRDDHLLGGSHHVQTLHTVGFVTCDRVPKSSFIAKAVGNAVWPDVTLPDIRAETNVEIPSEGLHPFRIMAFVVSLQWTEGFLLI